MFVENGFGRLGLLTILAVALIAALAFVARQGDDASTATIPASQDVKPSIDLLSENVKAVRVDSGGDVYYRIDVEYCLRNPGGECSVRFGLPSDYISGLSGNDADWQVVEDGTPVRLADFSRYGESSLELQSPEYGWRSRFVQGQVKTIRLSYKLSPETRESGDGAEFGDEELPITGCADIFAPVIEEISLPTGFDAEWVNRVGGLDVRIDVGRGVPRSLLRGIPNGYKSNGGKLIWRIDKPIRGAEFKLYIIRVADGLYRKADMTEVIRRLTDRNYSGYIKGLTEAQRRRYLRIVRNGIFARHGFVFSGDLADYFGKISWYNPDPGYTDDVLTQDEIDMIQAVIEAEKDL